MLPSAMEQLQTSHSTRAHPNHLVHCCTHVWSEWHAHVPPACDTTTGSTRHTAPFLTHLSPLTPPPFRKAMPQPSPQSVTIVCTTEVRQEMMAHSALGVPGSLCLLTNLFTTADFDEETDTRVSAKAWLLMV